MFVRTKQSTHAREKKTFLNLALKSINWPFVSRFMRADLYKGISHHMTEHAENIASGVAIQITLFVYINCQKPNVYFFRVMCSCITIYTSGTACHSSDG